ncbi:MAG: FAD-linked oxidase C-terminal domain-containing protein [Candidatus Lernaella stagnicola]|nr:FAD-linked oxidase C-terminal domain-containing protein [Candidatus Lernaella stagnicola]
MLPFKDLERIVGADNVLTNPGDRSAYATDAKVKGRPPVAVALPSTAVQVQEIVQACAQRSVALIARGAGTGTAGGAVPESTAVVLDLSRMNRLLQIDGDNLLADVEPGLLLADFQNAVEEQGLFYGPDPASRETSTLGGNAATNAGGLRAVKYGVTADWVQGLDVVLADGQLIHTGTRTRKGVVGYDLTRLFVGSEGTLGVITGLTLKLVPKPAAKQTLLAVFRQLRQAGDAVLAVLRCPVTPAAMELMDATTIDVVRAHIGDLIPPEHAALLLQVDGDVATVDRETETLTALLADTAATWVRRAADESEAEDLWAARRAISPAMYEIRPQKMADDVAVPTTRLVELFEGVTRIAAENHVLYACYGHAGDGNVHVNFPYDPKDTTESYNAQQAREQMLRLVLELGGTLSGEHGVGIAKRAFVPWEQAAALIDLQKRLKRAFDPLNILNPGKVFP